MKSKPTKSNHLAELNLYEAILTLSTVEEAKKFFEDLCTTAERRAMSDRWQVVDPIMQEIPYRTIHQRTQVSVTTIGRVARCISEGQGGYRLAYERLKKRSKRG